MAFSKDGKYMAAGDASTKQPDITIWEVDEIENNGRGYT